MNILLSPNSAKGSGTRPALRRWLRRSKSPRKRRAAWRPSVIGKGVAALAGELAATKLDEVLARRA